MFKVLLQFAKKMFKRLLSDDSGSAIILALIIIAGLVGTGIGSARLAKSNTQQTTLFEDSLKAYYASEAGIEAALLEWRFNHDVELWHRDNAFACAATYYGGGDKSICDKVILSRAVTLDKLLEPDNPVQDITDQIFDADGQMKTGDNLQMPVNQPWYELRMYYRDPYMPVRGEFGDPTNLDANPIRIDKDETYEIRFPDDDAYNVYMKWKPTYDSWLAEGDEIRLLWAPVVEDSDGNAKLYDDPTKYANPESTSAIKDRQYFSEVYRTNGLRDKTFNIDVARFNTGMKVLRITAQIKTNGNDYDANGEKKGVYLYMESFNESYEYIHIPDNQVTIEVVGHFNNISRSVEYTLDRQSGTIMDIFDYGVYSKDDFVK